MSNEGGARILKANARRGLGKSGRRGLGMNLPRDRFTSTTDRPNTAQGTTTQYRGGGD